MSVQLKDWPRDQGAPSVQAHSRLRDEDFEVEEVLGFSPDGDGEHCLLNIEKRGQNTADIERKLALLSGVPERDIGYCGLKDKNALTRQWFSVGLAGKPEPDWSSLDDETTRVISSGRHRRKLRRGVHKGNRFRLRLRHLSGAREGLEARLQQVQMRGVPNYFGEQRFGYGAGNFNAALEWLCDAGRAPRRQRRGHYLSAARSWLFNELLAERVREGSWEAPLPGDVCMLAGSGSFFGCDGSEPDLQQRAEDADIHPGLPLWGRGRRAASADMQERENACLQPWSELCAGLEQQGLSLSYRPARLIADDFCWQFCDDDQLLLDFELVSGGFATAVLRELVLYEDMSHNRGPAGGE